jgi:hypothetical protein
VPQVRDDPKPQRGAVPFLHHATAEYTSAACGARFASWTAGTARRADADGLGETATTNVSGTHTSIDADASAPLSQLRRYVGDAGG